MLGSSQGESHQGDESQGLQQKYINTLHICMKLLKKKLKYLLMMSEDYNTQKELKVYTSALTFWLAVFEVIQYMSKIFLGENPSTDMRKQVRSSSPT